MPDLNMKAEDLSRLLWWLPQVASGLTRPAPSLDGTNHQTPRLSPSSTHSLLSKSSVGAKYSLPIELVFVALEEKLCFSFIKKKTGYAILVGVYFYFSHALSHISNYDPLWYACKKILRFYIWRKPIPLIPFGIFQKVYSFIICGGKTYLSLTFYVQVCEMSWPCHKVQFVMSSLLRLIILGEFLHVQRSSQEFQYWRNFYMYSESPKSFNIGGMSTCTANLSKSFNIGGISTCTANLPRVSILAEFLHVQRISQEFQYWGKCLRVQRISLRVSILGEFLHVQWISQEFQLFFFMFWFDSFWTKQCQDIFDVKFNSSFIARAVAHTNTGYGALQYTQDRIVFVNGEIDPWHYLGITKSLPQAPAIFIPGQANLRYRTF